MKINKIKNKKNSSYQNSNQKFQNNQKFTFFCPQMVQLELLFKIHYSQLFYSS